MKQKYFCSNCNKKFRVNSLILFKGNIYCYNCLRLISKDKMPYIRDDVPEWVKEDLRKLEGLNNGKEKR